MSETDSEKWRRQRRERMLDDLHGLARGRADSAGVLAHVRGLYALGFSQRAITSAAGLRSEQVYMLSAAAAPTTYMRHARRYLALSPQTVFAQADGVSQVPSFAALRRYDALLWMGWRQADIEATALRLSGEHVWCNMLKPGERIAASRHRAMAAVFDALHMKAGPSRLTATRSHNRGALPPLAWDDVDDPTENPHTVDAAADYVDEIAVSFALAGNLKGPLTSAEVNAAIELGISRAMSYREIADRLGVKHDAVTQRVTRARLNHARSEVAA